MGLLGLRHITVALDVHPMWVGIAFFEGIRSFGGMCCNKRNLEREPLWGLLVRGVKWGYCTEGGP